MSDQRIRVSGRGPVQAKLAEVSDNRAKPALAKQLLLGYHAKFGSMERLHVGSAQVLDSLGAFHAKIDTMMALLSEMELAGIQRPEARTVNGLMRTTGTRGVRH